VGAEEESIEEHCGDATSQSVRRGTEERCEGRRGEP